MLKGAQQHDDLFSIEQTIINYSIEVNWQSEVAAQTYHSSILLMIKYCLL
jgi:hypothetical protein